MYRFFFFYFSSPRNRRECEVLVSLRVLLLFRRARKRREARSEKLEGAIARGVRFALNMVDGRLNLVQCILLYHINVYKKVLSKEE